MTYFFKYFILMLLPFCSTQKGSLHDFHTSLTEIQYNAKEKSLEVSIRIFTDDFESALTKLNSGQKVVINGATDKANPLIEKYIQQHFVILNAQKQKKGFNFIGKELEGEATWVYIEFANCENILSQPHILQNTILLDMFDDQSNLVNLFFGKVKKTMLFNAKSKSEVIAF